MPPIARPKDYSRLLALICVLLPVGTKPAIAQNITPAINNGTGTVIHNNNGQRFDIQGGTTSGNGANVFHSFQQFNLDAGQTANFISGPSIQNILGRVTGGNASIINGLIQVTGGNSNLYLMNPAGVIFGPNARLDVPASFSVTTATGIGFGNNWFNAIGTNDYQNLVGTPSGYRFDVSQPGAVVNTGNLELSPGQDLTLTGGTVVNTGELSTAGGRVTIAALEGGDVVRISQPGHILNLEVSNFGGNPEQITPLSLPVLLSSGNFNSNATGLTVDENGIVVLTGSGATVAEGVAIASGNINTSSNNIGGEINVLGQQVGILNANINADGINGGGDVFIGGDFQGNNRLPASQQTVINNNSFISANALENGDGGRVIIWSDGTTRFEGNISATGGEYSGDGGLVEVSGKQQLLANGFIDVSAENGEAGTILFDPENITVDEVEETEETETAEVEETAAISEEIETAEVEETAAISEEVATAEVEKTAVNTEELETAEVEETATELAEVEVEEIVDPFAPDDDYNVTISAENIESLEGNVTLQADNDITVNQEINTSESVELKAGRSININADIDTSSGNGNISLFGNENGANAANRSRGAANINQRENTTLNAGSGNITLRLGNLGRVGEINVENLTTTGRVLINANGGNIGLVSPSSLITAGNATFRTSDIGGIGLSNAPLRLDVTNLEAEVGTGGIFINAISDINIGGTDRNLRGILSEGEVDLSVGGDVTVSERIRAGGNINLAASDSINVNANINSASGNGDITLRANDESLGFADGRGGASISQLEGTNINAGSGDIDIKFGGLGNSGDISLANLTTTGAVRVNANDGNILRVGEDGLIDAGSASFETIGEGGIGSVEMPLRLDVGNLEAVAGSGGAFFDALTGVTVGGVRDELTGIVTTGGGDLELSAGGRVVVSEEISTTGGGDVRLSAGGNMTVSQEISTDGGGDIDLSAGRNLTAEADISTSVNSGDAGNISLDSGGTVKITTATLSSTATESVGGDVTLEAVGDIETGSIDSSGSTSGGAINITSTEGGINTKGGTLISGGLFIKQESDSGPGFPLENVGGNVTLRAVEDIETGSINSYGRQSGGAISITSTAGGINTIESGDNDVGCSEECSSGDITFQSIGRIFSDPLEGEINTGSIDSSDSTSSGSINITREGGINRIGLNSGGNSTAAGGNVTLEAVGEINTDRINSYGSTSGGAIGITSSERGINTSGLYSGRSSAAGGDVTLEAVGEINTGRIGSSGSTSGGAIDITSSEGSINAYDIDASSRGGIGGDIRLQAENSIGTGINAYGSKGGGNITLTSNSGDVIAPELNAASANGNDGKITVNTDAGNISVGTINLTIEDGGSDSPFNNSDSDSQQNTTADANTVNSRTGEVTLQAHNDITIDEAIESAEISSLELTAGRNININADIDTSAGNGNITLEANSQSANLDLRETGPGNVNMAVGTTLNAGSGEIVIKLGSGEIGNINLANLTTTGTVTVNASGGDILRVGENSTITAGRAAFQTFGNGSIGRLEMPLRLDADNLEAFAGSGGAFFDVLTGVTVGGVRDDFAGITTQGGDLELKVAGDITVTEDINSSVNSGNGGNISLESGGAIDVTAASLSSGSFSSAAGGDVTLEAVGEINTGSIYSSGSISGGAINITSSEGGINTGVLFSGSYSTAAGGNVTLEAVGEINTDYINSSGSTSGGAISITSSEGGINTTGLFSVGDSEAGGNVTLEAVGEINTGRIFSYGSISGGAISITSSEGGINTTGLYSGRSSAAGGDVTLEAVGDIETGWIDSDGSTSSGAISITSSEGGINTSLLISGGYSTEAGGNVTLEAVGDIETLSIDSSGSTSSGAINITSSEGGINTKGGGLFSSSATTGGNVTLEAVGDIETGGINSQGGTSSGAINITSSEGGINTTGGVLFSGRYSSTTGGDVTLEAVGDIETGRIYSYGSTSSGAINITSSEGGINTTGGVLYSGGNSTAAGGNVTLEAVGDIETGGINSQGGTSSGAINIASSEGGINTTGGGLFSGRYSSTTGGNVTLEAVGDIETLSIDSSGSTSGGAIGITSSEGGINTSDLDTSSREGTAGNVQLQAKNSISTSINASGSQQGGNIALTSETGDVFAQELNATADNGNSPEVTINANTGSIEVGTINFTIEEGGRDNPFSDENSTDNTTADADTVNSQTGEVSLQAHNDITINEAIESAEISSLELTAGRNININADIDTSAGNGNITLEANSQSANRELREAGPGNVNMAAGTTLDAGSGEIVITLGLGEIEEIGNINLANLTTTGTVTVNASGGDILRVGENSTITAGGAAFQTFGNGSIGRLEMPLQLDADNLEAVAGSGGAFFEVLTGVTVGGVRDDFAGITTQGGDLELKVAGDITVTEGINSSVNSGDGGNISLESGGAIRVTAATLFSGGRSSAAGGDVTLEAVGEINTGYIDSSGRNSGGAINITSSEGGINTTGGGLFSGGRSSEAGGNVTLEAVGEINTGSIYSDGSISGGAINITSSEGGINTTGGVLFSVASSTAEGGNVTLEAVGDINTGRINSNGSISGGAINITSSEGGINTTGDGLTSGGNSEVGGDVTLEAVGDINTGSINSSGSTSSGAINITSSEGGINTIRGDLNSSATETQNSETEINSKGPGNVTLEAARNILTGNINATGNQQSGDISIESRFGNVDTSGGQLNVNSENGIDGNLNIQAFTGSIRVGDIDGTRNLTVAPDGQDNPFAENEPNSSITSDADNINSRRGEVTLQAHNDITIDQPIEASEISNLQIQAGRNINLNAKIDTSGGNGNIALKANDEGADATYRLPGRGSVTMAPGTTLNAGSGDISIFLGSFGDEANIGNITLGHLNTTGSVTVGAGGGNIFRASPSSLITAGSASFLTSDSGGIGSPRERLRVRVDNLEAAAGSGGAFFNSPTQGLTITGITTTNGGDVEVRANGDITVSAPISTATNSGDAGNITLKTSDGGNIDTSAVSLDAGSSPEDNGGTVTLTTVGDGDITTGAISTIPGDSRNPYIGDGNGGDIILNAGGNINTTAGPIDSSTFSDSGDGGKITFRGDGNITTGDLYSYAWFSGNGGNVSLESQRGDLDTSAGRINSYSFTGSGGNVTLRTVESGNIRTGDIYSRSSDLGNGGSIVLHAAGDIDTTYIESNPTWLDSGSGGGSGGKIELRAGGDIMTGDIRTFAGGIGVGGDITITAGGSVNTTGGNVFSSSVAGDTGSINITAEAEVTTGNIDLASGFRVDESARAENPDVKPTPEPVTPTSGVAGDINITSSNGTIDTSAGLLDSRSPDGSGNITLTAPGDITTGTIHASALNQAQPTEGGEIDITSSKGDINATGVIETFSEIGTAGNVTLNAAGTVNTRDILSDGDERGGNIAITSDSENTINVRGRLETFSESGTGGDITLTATGSVNTQDITTFGNTESGDITITSQNNNVNTRAITTQAEGGDSGNISVNGQNVATGNLRSIAQDSAGGIRVQATDGSVSTEDIEVRSEEGTAGPVEVEATEDVETGDIEVTAAQGDAEIDISAGGDISGGDQTATAENGNASIENQAGGSINLRDQIATAEGGNASIDNEAGGNITAGDQIATAEGGNASIDNVAEGDITVGDQTAVAEGGDASINNEAGGNITAGDQTAISFGGDATITNIAEGNITTGDQTALSEGGNAFITNEAGGNLTTGDQTAIAPDGINQVTNNAGGTINTGELTEGGGDITPFLRDNPVLLVENDIAGPVTTSPTPSVQTPVVTPAPSVQTPVVTPAPSVQTPAVTPSPSVQTPVVTPSPAPSVQTPAVTPAPAPSVQTPVVTPAPSVQTPVLTTPTPSVSTPVVETSPSAIANNPTIQNKVIDIVNPEASTPESGSSITNDTNDTQQILETLNALNTSPMTVAANTQTLIALEESRNQEFADYLELDLSFDQSAIKNVREVLALMAEQTGKNSAVVYVSLYAEEVQLILYTAEGEPILKTIPGIKREEVIEIVKNLREKIVTSVRFRNLKTYLPPAQQLHQWLIAPISAELEAANIDTLLFSMDEGLRGLPVAALHDGEQFLIEQYSLSMIPSISLIDSRYRSVKDTTVLAMGTSEFTELEPLPAVPVELETITTDLWQGNALIDEEFTVSNLIAQRQQQAYPIIHLATHGEFQSGDVSNSYIQFWGEEKLTLDRVRELGLNNPPVELLVFSACRTAVGDTNAELGFAGLAVAAGVKSAVASLWYVSDEGTLGLMTEFYSNLDEVTIKAEALRQAQLAMLRGEVRIEDGQLRGSGARSGAIALPSALAHIVNSNLSHPYYWSGFTTIGSPW